MTLPLPTPHAIAMWPSIRPAYTAAQMRLYATAYHAHEVANEKSALRSIAGMTRALADLCATLADND